MSKIVGVFVKILFVFILTFNPKLSYVVCAQDYNLVIQGNPINDTLGSNYTSGCYQFSSAPNCNIYCNGEYSPWCLSDVDIYTAMSNRVVTKFEFRYLTNYYKGKRNKMIQGELCNSLLKDTLYTFSFNIEIPKYKHYRAFIRFTNTPQVKATSTKKSFKKSYILLCQRGINQFEYQAQGHEKFFQIIIVPVLNAFKFKKMIIITNIGLYGKQKCLVNEAMYKPINNVTISHDTLSSRQLDIDTVRIYEDFVFNFDSYNLSDSGLWVLHEIVKNIDDLNRVAKIEFVGHTDSVGSEEYNLALSRRRAYEVMETMKNLLPESIEYDCSGRGESALLRTSPADSKKQRRVEIIIKYKR